MPQHASGRPGRSSWGWPALWILVGVVTLVRVVFLVVWCPYELVADEAHYWDWARNLDLSYYSKGPGVAWSIAASTAVFGDHEWAVRLPTALLSALTPIGAGLLGWGIALRAGSSRHDAARVAAWSALALLSIPIFHGTALLMTIDGPYVAFWTLSLLPIFALLAPIQKHGAPLTAQRAVGLGLLLGLFLGVAFLYKYTILLILPGLALFAVLRWRTLAPVRSKLALASLAALAVFAVVASPVAIWNAREGWPTVRHLLGHLDSQAGDIPMAEPRPYEPMWTIEYIGAQIGLVGPLLILMVLVSVASVRQRTTRPGWPSELLLLCCGWPIVIIYLLVSLRTDVEGNWPIAGYVSLAVLVAMYAPGRIDSWRQAVRRWKDDPERPKEGFLRRKPETAFQVLWHWSVGYGAIAALGMMLIVPIGRLPVMDRIVPLYRLTGASERAAAVDEVIARVSREQDLTEPPLIITTSYSRAALLAFYMDGRPAVRSASAYRGGRRSAYDHFDSTRLDDPALFGRAALLLDASAESWARSGLGFEGLNTLEEAIDIVWAERYLGPKAEHQP